MQARTPGPGALGPGPPGQHELAGPAEQAERPIVPLLIQAGYVIEPAGTRIVTLAELTTYAPSRDRADPESQTSALTTCEPVLLSDLDRLFATLGAWSVQGSRRMRHPTIMASSAGSARG
jgi:hypothetical protein